MQHLKAINRVVWFKFKSVYHCSAIYGYMYIDSEQSRSYEIPARRSHMLKPHEKALSAWGLIDCLTFSGKGSAALEYMYAAFIFQPVVTCENVQKWRLQLLEDKKKKNDSFCIHNDKLSKTL